MIQILFDESIFLSVPFGMDNSYDLDNILHSKTGISGIFTMGRTLNHDYIESHDFHCLHRYDQADFFNGRSDPKELLIKSFEIYKEQHA